jgi:preprotein translocase subunit SecD
VGCKCKKILTKWSLLAILIMVTISFLSCSFLSSNQQDRTDAKIPGMYLEIKLEPIDVKQSAISKEDMTQIQDVMDRRINSLGITSSKILIVGQTMQIEIAGYTNLEEAKNVIGKTGELLFTDEIGTVIISGKNIQDSQFAFQTVSADRTKEPVVQLTFDEEGTKLFSNGTKANIGKTIVITLDENILMTPKVNTAISDGKVVITFGGGSSPDTIKTAKEMASILKGGSIPARVTILKAELR